MRIHQPMHLELLGFTAEGTLIHQSDLLCEEVQLSADVCKLLLQGADDHDQRAFIQFFHLIGSKL